MHDDMLGTKHLCLINYLYIKSKIKQVKLEINFKNDTQVTDFASRIHIECYVEINVVCSFSFWKLCLRSSL